MLGWVVINALDRMWTEATLALVEVLARNFPKIIQERHGLHGLRAWVQTRYLPNKKNRYVNHPNAGRFGRMWREEVMWEIKT
jgi:hypothetical protein